MRHDAQRRTARWLPGPVAMALAVPSCPAGLLANLQIGGVDADLASPAPICA